MKIVISGFEPFGKDSLNASWEAVQGLKPTPDIELCKVHLPVEFDGAMALLKERLEQEQPDAIICTGVASGRETISLECCALNIQHGRIADNAGRQPRYVLKAHPGENALFTTLPLDQMETEMKQIGLPVQVSFHAGTYVCNDVYYGALQWAIQHNIPCLFVHVPACEGMESRYQRPIEESVSALQWIIRFMHQGQC